MEQDLYMCGDTNFTVRFNADSNFGTTGDHSLLYNREEDNAHPISAITNLKEQLDEIVQKIADDKVTETLISESGEFIVKFGNGDVLNAGAVANLSDEQVAAAVGNFIEEHTTDKIQPIYLTKFREINKSHSVKIWMGTQEEYDLIEPKANVEYIITDADPLAELKTLQEKVTELEERLAMLEPVAGDDSNGLLSDNGWLVQKFKSGILMAWKYRVSIAAKDIDVGKTIRVPSSLLTEYDYIVTALNEAGENLKVYQDNSARSVSITLSEAETETGISCQLTGRWK